MAIADIWNYAKLTILNEVLSLNAQESQGVDVSALQSGNPQ